MLTASNPSALSLIVRTLSLTVMISLSHTAAAQWYIGLDTTNIDYKFSFEQGNENYDVQPSRFKLGHLNDEGYGFEFQAFSRNSDASPDPFNNLFEISLEKGYGLFAQWSSTHKKRGFYGLAGIAYIDTRYTEVASGRADTDSFSAIGIDLGWYYKFSNKLKLTIDYTQLRGDADYPTFITGEVSPQLTGFGIGLNYTL